MEEALNSYYIAEIVAANSDKKKKEGCLISSELATLPSDVHFLIWKRDINLSQIQLSRFNVIKSIAQRAGELAYRTHKKYVRFLCS